ncbi:MAG: hypothetical protein KatS3mg100_185 [Candidatus Parcubacteria bacterium]|nr:MAG: hypothetical protein KatS3mg100_185 [Candidatus Parcubacteria bacterium]
MGKKEVPAPREASGGSKARDIVWVSKPVSWDAFLEAYQEMRALTPTNEVPPLGRWRTVWVDPEPSFVRAEGQSFAQWWMSFPRFLSQRTQEEALQQLHDPLLVPFVQDNTPFAFPEESEVFAYDYHSREWKKAQAEQASLAEEVVSAGPASFTLSPVTSRDLLTTDVIDCLVLCAQASTRSGSEEALLAHIWPGVFVDPARSDVEHLTALHLPYWQRSQKDWQQQCERRREVFARLLTDRLRRLREKADGGPLRLTLTLGGFSSRIHTFGNLLAQLEAAREVVQLTAQELGTDAVDTLACLPPVGQVRHPQREEWFPGVHAVGLAAKKGEMVVALPRGQYLEHILQGGLAADCRCLLGVNGKGRSRALPKSWALLPKMPCAC